MSKEEKKQGEMSTEEGTGFVVQDNSTPYRSKFTVKSDWRPDPEDEPEN